MAKRVAQNIKLGNFDDLFGEAPAPVEVSLHELHDFNNHPFKVTDDEGMVNLTESIKQYGVYTPGVARIRPEGGYELLSGHRRKRACALAGLLTMPVFVVEISDDDAIIRMVDENMTQRQVILPSEKARSYLMKYNAVKNSRGCSAGRNLDQLGEEFGESGKTMQRYIWLSRLIDKLLDMVDEKTLSFVAGVDISFLSREFQEWVYSYISENPVKISNEQSAKLKEYGKTGELTQAMIRLILSEEKPKERKFTLKADRINKYFPEDYSDEDIEKVIIDLLEAYASKV